MKKTKVVFCSFPDYSSNAKPLYEYMKKEYSDKMELVWAVSSEEMVEKLRKMEILAYNIGTEEYFDYCKNVDVFFTTHANIIGEKNLNSIYVELWHGIGSKQSGYLSDKVSNDDKKWYSEIGRKIDYLILPSDFWRVIFSTILNCEYSKIVPIGYPKLDYFKNPKAKENLAKVLERDVSTYSKIIYYMPTFRKGCARASEESKFNVDNAINIEAYNDDDLDSFLKKNNYLLCIKKHPSEELESRFQDRENIITIHENDLSDNMITINEILDASDLMITDYSSLGVEYLFLNKPVLYINTDEEEYQNNRGIIFSEPNFWMPGYKAKKLDELIKGIEGSFSNNYKYKEEMEEKRKLWFGKLNDGGCKNICDFLFNKNGEINEEIKKKDKVDGITLKIEELKEKNISLSKTIDEKNEVIAQREKRIKELDDFIAQIINSKGWKFLENMRAIKGKISCRNIKNKKSE